MKPRAESKLIAGRYEKGKINVIETKPYLTKKCRKKEVTKNHSTITESCDKRFILRVLDRFGLFFYPN